MEKYRYLHGLEPETSYAYPVNVERAQKRVKQVDTPIAKELFYGQQQILVVVSSHTLVRIINIMLNKVCMAGLL